MSRALAVTELEIEIAVPCAAWLEAYPDAEAIAGAVAHLALARAVEGGPIPADDHIVVGIRLTDDKEQRQLNRTYRGKDMPTNVLSFPLADLRQAGPPGAPVLLGDIVLAFETVQHEAREQQKPLAEHLQHLVVHGVLHLLGFDHESEPDAADMEAREIEILAALGVPDPYRDIM